MERCITCKYYYSAWEGSKTSISQPAWCFKKRVRLTKGVNNFDGGLYLRFEESEVEHDG